MTPWILFGYVILSAIMWKLGGSIWKSFRRHLLPLITIAVLIYLKPSIWFLAVPAGLVQVAVNTMGYGDNSPLWKKILVSAMIGLPAIVISYHLWWAPIYTLLMFGGHYWLSRVKNYVTWGIVELVAGVAQGSAIVFAYLRGF